MIFLYEQNLVSIYLLGILHHARNSYSIDALLMVYMVLTGDLLTPPPHHHHHARAQPWNEGGGGGGVIWENPNFACF